MEVVAQRVEGVRLGGVAAFSISGFGEEELAILVVETRERDLDQRNWLAHEITKLMHEHFGINVIIDLVKPGTLPRTSFRQTLQIPVQGGVPATPEDPSPAPAGNNGIRSENRLI